MKVAEECCQPARLKQSKQAQRRRKNSTGDGLISEWNEMHPTEASLRKRQRVEAREAKLEAKREAQKAKDDKKKVKRERKRQEKLEKEEKKQQKQAQEREEKAKLYDSDGMTEYSRNRSRRRVRRDLTEKALNDVATAQPQFVEVGEYKGVETDQPFRVVVDPGVYFVVATHAHLSLNEVIGFLAGKWEPTKNRLTVCAAFPGRATLEESTECELDPESAVELRDEIETEGLVVVGWYHSHPFFEPTPSNWDVTNQKNYQTIFRDHKYGTEPFIGLIWCPYDYELNGLNDSFKWFYIDLPNYLEKAMYVVVEQKNCGGKELTEQAEVEPTDQLKTKEETEEKQVFIRGLKFLKNFVFNRYDYLRAPIVFGEVWKKRAGKEVTYADKLECSLSRILPSQVDEFKLVGQEKGSTGGSFEIGALLDHLCERQEKQIQPENQATSEGAHKNGETEHVSR